MVLQERIFSLTVNLIGIVGNTEIINDDISIKSKKVNSFTIKVYQSDTLDIIKQKICYELLKNIEYENDSKNTEQKRKTCIYCFNHKGNKIITQTNDNNYDIDFEDDLFDDDDDFMETTTNDTQIIYCATCKKKYEYRHGVNLSKLSNDILHIEQCLPVPEFLYLWKDNTFYGHSICHKQNMDDPYNCENLKQNIDNKELEYDYVNIFKFLNDNSLSNLKDIYKNFNYQIQSLSSRRNNDLGKYTSNILRTLQNKEQNESALLRKYNKAINDFDLKLGDGKENIIKKKLLDLKKKRYELLSSIYQNESLVDKNRIDFNTLFYNLINENSSSFEINMAYFPDYYLYYNFLTNNDNFRSVKKKLSIIKDNLSKDLKVFSKIYWPYINFENYEYQYNKKDTYYLYEKISNWKFSIQNYDKIIDQFKEIEIPSSFKKQLGLEQYTHKIWFEINRPLDTVNKPNYLNLTNVMHLFKPNKTVPYLVTYLPKESKLLQKMTKTIQKKGIHRKLKWNIEMPDVIQFRIRIPKTIKDVDGEVVNKDIYMQVQLYSHKSVWFTINLSREARIYIDKTQMKEIIKGVNNFINKLNSYNIGNLGISPDNRKIKTASIDIENWDDPKTNVDIHSINSSIVINRVISYDDIRNKTLIRMLYPYIELDNSTKGNIMNFRFLRLEHQRNYEAKSKKDILLHNFISEKIEAILQEADDGDDRDELKSYEKDELIEALQKHFHMTSSQAVITYNNWDLTKEKIYGKKLKSAGILYQLSKSHFKRCVKNKCYDALDEAYQWCIMGFKSFDQWEYLSDFSQKLVYLIYHILYREKLSKKDYNYEIVKYFRKIYDRLDNEYDSIMEEEEKTIHKITGYTYLKRLKQAFDITTKCPNCGAKIKHTTTQCPYCNTKVDLNRNLYAKRCAVNRQPVGTAAKTNKHAPKILTIKEHNALNENIQSGGYVDAEQQDEYHELLAKFEKKEKKYEKLAEDTGLDKYEQKKDEYTKKTNEVRYYITITSRELKPSRWIDDYEGQTEWTDKQVIQMLINLGKKLTTIKKTLPTQRNKNNKFKETILQIYNKNKWNEKLRKLFIKYYGIEDAIKAIKKRFKHLKKNEVIPKIDDLLKYHIWKSNTFPKTAEESKGRNPPGWQKKECKLIWSHLSGKKNLKIADKKKLKQKIDHYFESYKLNNLTYRDETKIGTVINPYDHESYNDRLESIMKPIGKSNKGEPTGHILEWQGKIIKCPNPDKKANKYPGFLDIHFNKSDKSGQQIEITEDEIRKNACHPCCFTGINKKIKRNLLYCTELINKKTYDEMLSLDTKIDNYISTNNNANLDLTFGKLPTRLHVLFNHYTDFDKNFNANVHKAPGFVLQGNSRCIKYHDENLCSGKDLSTERGFYSVILQYTDRTFNELISHIGDYLTKNREIISFLNQGKIYAKFKTIVEKKYLGAKQYKNVSINLDHIIKEFIKFLEDPDYDIVDFDKKYIIDLISRPGVIHRDGLNIVLFKQTPHKLPSNNINLGKMFIKCLDDIFIEDYYNDDKKFIFIYEYSDRSYESIVYKKPSKGKLDLVRFFDPKGNNFSELMEIMKEWYLKSCTQQYTSRAISTKNWNILTAKQSVQLLENVAKYDSKYTPKKIIYDPISQRSLYIVTINDYIIPVKQSIYSNEKYKKITNITKYESSYKDTLKYLEKLNTIIDNNSEFKKIDTYENAGVYIKNNKATHLVLLNDRYIPIKKMKFTTVSEKNNETIIKLEDGTKTKISNIKIYNKINEIVIAGNEWDNIRDIIISIRIQEIYNRTILELAELLDKTDHKKIKANIIKLIKNSHNKQSKIEEYKTHESYNIKRQLYRIVEKLVKNKLSTTMGEDRSSRYAEKYHIRQTCKTIEENAKNNDIGGCDDNFCIPTLSGCKLYIPEDKLKLFVGMLVSELLTYGKRKWNENKNKFDIIVSGRIIDNSVSPIVDIDVFENHDDIIYERKTDLGNLLQNIKLHKEMS
jgi:hypothetical protein